MKIACLRQKKRWAAAAIVILGLAWCAGFGLPALAATSSTESPLTIIPACARQSFDPTQPAPPPPDLNCVLLTFANIARLVLGITGSLALFMFVYGGWLMVASAGEREKVEKGKTVIKNAVIGILVIMCSGLLIQYAINVIGVSQEVTVIGQQCDIGGQKGQYVEIPGGGRKCVSSCADPAMKTAGFSCKSAATPGVYCIANLCPGSADQLCCAAE